MAEKTMDRYEVEPGCWIVSREGTSRSGDAMVDTVRALVEGVDRRLAAHDRARRGRRQALAGKAGR